MIMHTCSILISFLVGMVLCAAAQTNEPQTTSPQTESSPSSDTGSTSRSIPAGGVSGIFAGDAESDGTNEDVPAMPALLGGRGTTLEGKMERGNYLRGGLNVGAAYSDNTLLAPGPQVGNTTYSVYPNIAIEQTTSRTRLSLGYGAGLTVNQRLSTQNQQAQNLNFDSEFRLSPHVNLRVTENFSLVAGIFGANAAAGFDPGQGGGNGTLITPVANQRTSNTVVDANYHYALNDVVGASGSFRDLHYNQVITGAGSLTDNRSEGASAFWLHQIFRGNWAGVSYAFQRITYDPNGETRTHAFSVVDSLRLSKNLQLSAFVGPEYTENDGVAATGTHTSQFTSFNSWGTAGGVEASWQTTRNGVTGGYSRQVSDGGGLLGAVRLQNVHGGFRHEFRPGWSVSASASYGNNASITLATTTTASTIDVTSVGALIARDLRRSFGFQLGYFHDFQDQSGSLNPAQNFNLNRNRAFVNLSYQWAMPLGR